MILKSSARVLELHATICGRVCSSFTRARSGSWPASSSGAASFSSGEALPMSSLRGGRLLSSIQCRRAPSDSPQVQGRFIPCCLPVHSREPTGFLKSSILTLSVARQPYKRSPARAAGVGTSYTLIALGTQSAIDAFKQVHICCFTCQALGAQTHAGVRLRSPAYI